MSIGQMLDQIRDLYLDQFAQAVESCRGDASVKVIAEAAFSDAGGEAVGTGFLGLPLRADIIVADDDTVKESFRVDSALGLSFDPITFDWDERLEVRLHPFQWDWCQAKLFGLSVSPDWQPLVDWFMSSFNVSSSSATEKDFSGVVHFMSDPETKGDYYEISLDLGSAPVETFETLLDAFLLVGAKSVEIGQF